MNIGGWALLASVGAALLIGLVLHLTADGVRKTAGRRDVEETMFDHLPEQLGLRLAEDSESSLVTLLQLSTAFCAPCRHTRILLGNFAQHTDGVRHVELDLTDHPEWSAPLRVHTTPTTLVLDSAGRELFRVAGVPKREALAAALRPHLP